MFRLMKNKMALGMMGLGLVFTGCSATIEGTKSSVPIFSTTAGDPNTEIDTPVPQRDPAVSENPFENFSGKYTVVAGSFRQERLEGDCSRWDELEKITALSVTKYVRYDYLFEMTSNSDSLAEYLIQEHFDNDPDSAEQINTSGNDSAATYTRETRGNGTYQLIAYRMENIDGREYQLVQSHQITGIVSMNRTCVSSVRLRLR